MNNKVKDLIKNNYNSKFKNKNNNSMIKNNNQ